MKPIFHFGCGLVMGSFLTLFLASLWGISSLNEKSQTDEKETAQVVQQEQPSAPETTAGESKTHQSRTVEKRTVSAQPQKRVKKPAAETGDNSGNSCRNGSSSRKNNTADTSGTQHPDDTDAGGREQTVHGNTMERGILFALHRNAEGGRARNIWKTRKRKRDESVRRGTRKLAVPVERAHVDALVHQRKTGRDHAAIIPQPTDGQQTGICSPVFTAGCERKGSASP